MTEHRFGTSKAKEAKDVSANADWVNAAYSVLGDIAAIEVVHDLSRQRRGVDKIITLTDGKVLRVQEKYRDQEWHDVLLEYESVSTNSTPGWIEREDHDTDYLAYIVKPSRRIDIFPWRALRSAWSANGSAWKDRYPTKQARNEGYWTSFVCVPTKVLWVAINQHIPNESTT